MFGLLRGRRHHAAAEQPRAYSYTYTGAPWPPPEPWRATCPAEGVVWLPTGVLRALCDPARVAEIVRLDGEALALLEDDMRANGLRRVLELAVDDRGRVRVRDGHHRVVVAERLGLARLPVVITRSDGIKGWGRPVADVLTSMLAPALR